LDTDVVVAAARSPSGASAELIRAAAHRQVTLLATNALMIEYEAICLRGQHLEAAGFSVPQMMLFLDALCHYVQPVQGYYLWRPQLRDPNDEMVLEAAMNAQATAIVTFNVRDFDKISERFCLEILTPKEALQRI
jgi:putative PIN family toxin of toxin-antitoxin system